MSKHCCKVGTHNKKKQNTKCIYIDNSLDFVQTETEASLDFSISSEEKNLRIMKLTLR